MMEVLREITEDELNYIISRLKNDLPYAIKDLFFILSSKRSKELSVNFTGISDKVLPTFYVPRNGAKENCTIFAVTSEPDHTVWYFTYQESLEEVKTCFENTNLIKWTKTVLFVTIHREHVEVIFEHLRKNKYTMQHDEACSYYFFPKEDAKKIEVLTPEGTFIRKLEETDSKLCNSIWQYSYSGSETFICSLILINGGYGLFDKPSHQLLSFAIINDHFATGVLNTIKEARGKKYGELVANILTKKIAEDLDITPTVYINSKNVPSLNLYKKLGYQKIGDCNWVVVGDNKLW